MVRNQEGRVAAGTYTMMNEYAQIVGLWLKKSQMALSELKGPLKAVATRYGAVPAHLKVRHGSAMPWLTRCITDS